ncbi:hypothetical protein ACJX0J_025984, partial [Zea mays]
KNSTPKFRALHLRCCWRVERISVAHWRGMTRTHHTFFDKTSLDNILEASMDQHFHSIMQNLHTQRRRDMVQELMNEIGPAGTPLNVVMKDADIQFLDVVDKVLLGNKWLRKAFGIQPKFPYVVDSFEESNLFPNIWPGHDRKFEAQESDNKCSRLFNQCCL